MNSKLEDIYSQIPGSTCPEGCGRCCGPVFPSLAELRNIKDWCQRRNIEFKDFLNVGSNGDCPYLKQDQRCAIYPVRPFLCRILGVSSELPCPTRRCIPVKVLNRPQSDALYKAMYLHGKEKPRVEKHRRLIQELIETNGSR